MFKLNVLAMSKSTIFASAASEKFFLYVAWESTVIVTFVDFDIQL